MGIKFGEIDAGQIIENEFRIMVLEKIVDLLIRRSATTIVGPGDVQKIREEVVSQLQKKYPNSGISLTTGKP